MDRYVGVHFDLKGLYIICGWVMCLFPVVPRGYMSRYQYVNLISCVQTHIPYKGLYKSPLDGCFQCFTPRGCVLESVFQPFSANFENVQSLYRPFSALSEIEKSGYLTQNNCDYYSNILESDYYLETLLMALNKISYKYQEET